jgi:hypothetical protein
VKVGAPFVVDVTYFAFALAPDGLERGAEVVFGEQAILSPGYDYFYAPQDGFDGLLAPEPAALALLTAGAVLVWRRR